MKQKNHISTNRNHTKTMNCLKLVAILSLVINLPLCLGDTTSENSTIIEFNSNLNLAKNEASDKAVETTTSSDKLQQKPMLSTGNELWDNVIRDCLKKPTFSCLQKNVYNYFDTTLKLNDVNVTNNVLLTRNDVEYKEPIETNKDEENEILYFEGRAAPIEEVSNALYEKGVKFLVTHNMEFKLPEMMFDGASFRISPRSIEGNGIIAKIEYVPKTEVESRSVGDVARLFKKKIKKFFRKKIVLGILAVVLIVKLIKIKLFWLLPLLVGVGTAKKLVLKFLLFLFPALSHIFKLCGYYHANYHKTNYHHHKHHINHLHTVLYDGHGHEGPLDHVKDFLHSKHPKGHASEYLHSAPVPPHLSYSDEDWQFSGPGLGSEYISELKRISLGHKPKLDDAHEITQWGLAHPHQNGIPPTNHHSYNTNPLIQNRIQKPPRGYGVPGKEIGTPLGPNSIKPHAAYGSPTGPYLTSSAGAASQNHPQYVQAPFDENLVKAQRHEALRIQKEQQLIAKQQSILNTQPFVSDVEPLTPKPLDPFYSPIINKLDQTFNHLGYTNEQCKERLVCNMYQNPTKYSPHSNYVSAELSRDSSELQRPAQSNPAVVRFYRYVQAARDGQEQRDCISLYPCARPTKK